MLKIFKYQLPFIKPFRIAGTEFNYRTGIILTYTEGDITAYGEVAPLPGFSRESLEQAQSVIQFNKPEFEASLKNNSAHDFLEAIEKVHHFSSLSFGMDTLIHDLNAKRERKSLSEFLFKKKPGEIKSNAVIPLLPKKELIETAAKYISEGFSVLKIKLGRNFNEEKSAIEVLQNQFPAIRLRLDANESWKEKDAIHNLNALNPSNIEYCEQPVPAEKVESLANIRKAVNIPIAADESIRSTREALQLIKAQAVDFLILKPALLGSFKNIFVTKSLADSHNIGVIFTSAMESAVATTCIANLAYGLSGKNCHGLSTGLLFSYDSAKGLGSEGSTVTLPASDGLGVVIDKTKWTEI